MTTETSGTVTPFKDFEGESWPEPDSAVKAAAESVMSPRAASAARQARAPERKAKKRTMADDVAEAVKKHQDTEAENIRRAKAVSEVEAAASARAVARDAAAIDAAAKAAPRRPAPEPEPESANPVVRAMRAGAAEGQVGRVNVGAGALPPTIEEFAALGSYARPGRTATAAVLAVDRDGPGRLGGLLRSPAARDNYVRSDTFVTELDSPAGHAWLVTQIADVRSLPNVGSLLDILIVIAEQCIPADLSGLQQLASESRACIALIDSSAEPGWTPTNATKGVT